VDTSDVLASVATGLSAISLGWQAWSQRAEGSVVGVTTSQAPFMVPTQSTMIPERLPHRLEANTSASWRFHTRTTLRLMALRPSQLRRPELRLGSGR
jgi:hypothetical protein